MGLHPLEFSECYLDNPCFREKIKAHEAELEKTNRFIKELYKDGKNLINATKQLGMAQRKFAQCLGEFHFEYIGDAKTDDERCIGKCGLSTSGEEKVTTMRNITETLMKPLEKFRKEQIGAVRTERKKYDKETEKYYSSLEKLLNMSAKKKEPQLQEADVQVETLRQAFQGESLNYVCKLQDIQEKKKFECVEPMLAFFQTLFTFYHQGYELAKDFDHYKRALQINIQNTRSRFEGTRSEVAYLMKRFSETPQVYRQTSPISFEGYLYVQEKRPPPFGSSWVKRYCTFVKEQKILHMVTFDHRSGGKIGETESITLKSCLRKTTDMLDRRFCFDLEITDRYGTVLTVQALSEDDYKLWMQAMGGKEPVSQPLPFHHLPHFVFAVSHYVFLGINDQGLYRVGGVSSKVQKLLSLMIDEKSNEVDLSTSEDWDIKTITSALKLYLRSLPEPLMTYGLYKEFISLAKGGSPESRIQAVHCLVHKLPERNRQVLGLLMKHLANVAAHSKANLMTVANLGVVFGPTLMRPQEETVAAIMDLKFQNIVVEILIEHHEKIPTVDSVLHSPPCAERGSRNSQPYQISHFFFLSASLLQTFSHALPPLRLTNSLTHSLSPCSLPSLPPSPSRNEQADPRPRLNCAVILPKACVTGRRAKAVYPCEAEHDSELSFQVGAIFSAVTQSREPGWLEGDLDGKRGLIPENYVEML
uniref:Rho GTPase-activating protein 10 n=1 Tax=Nothobranchius furzeri TaxID=105023 RepID=A0A8C6Q520_NOTFU